MLQFHLHDGSNFLAWILKDTPRERTGIDVGFLTTVGDFARQGAETQRRRNAA